MNIIGIIMAAFALLGAADRMLGNKFGLGREFEKGFELFGGLALSMIGMIAISPLIAQALKPALGFVQARLGLDPSILTAALFACDMGGATLSKEVAADAALGRFNALVTASMMGCTVSFTIPCALGAVKARRRELLMGLLCGVVTIPVGCFAGGLILGLPVGRLLWNILPLAILAAVIGAGLAFFPNGCVKVFSAFGALIKLVVTAGLALCLVRFLTGAEILPGLDTLENGAAIVLNCCAVLAGALPMLKILSRILKKPMAVLGQKMGIGERAVLGLISTLANSITTYEMMDDMDSRGALVNAAFSVSAAFVLADHLAFALAFDPGCLPAMMLGKLAAGALAIGVAMILSKRGVGETSGRCPEPAAAPRFKSLI